jgi:tetratricopeptide (TPR) repeat protein
VLSCILSAGAKPVDQWFARANQHYEQQRYDSALVYYQRIEDAGVQDAALLYNIGNAYYRLENIGHALLYYERARELAPGDPDILANIRFANRNIIDRIPEPERTFFDALLWRLHTALSLRAQLWLLLALLFGLSGAYAAWLFASRNARLWLVYGASLLILLTTAAAVSAGVKIYQKEQVRHAIVLAKTLEAKNQPNGSTVLFSVHEGVKFRIRSRSGGWALVSLPNGVSGWVETAALGII